MEHVAGYCIVNDVSERAFQAERSGQWTKGKARYSPYRTMAGDKDETDPKT